MSVIIDVVGKDCPIPLFELKKAIGKGQSGEVIEVIFTCPEAVETLPTYAEENGHEVLEFSKLPTQGWRIVIKKK